MTEISSLGSRFQRLREGLGWTQGRMARVLGVGRTSVTQYEGGQRLPSLRVLMRLAEAVEVDLGWLLTGRTESRVDLMDLPQPVVHFPARQEDRPEGFHPADYYAVPLLSDPVAAGAPLISTDLVEEWAWIHVSQVGQRSNLAALRVEGDSMSPLIRDGDIIAIDRDDRFPPGVFAVRVDEGVTVKHVKLKGDALLLIPENRDHEERLVTIPEGGRMDDLILGRAVWQWSSLAGQV